MSDPLSNGELADGSLDELSRDELVTLVLDLEERFEKLERENTELAERLEESEARAEKAERMAAANSAHIRELLVQVEGNNLKPDRNYWNHFLARLCQVDIDDFESDPFQRMPAVERVGTMIQRHETMIEENDGPKIDPMKENWVACVKAAQNLENDTHHARMDGYVALYAKDIKTATGHSKRHCLNLIEQLGEEHEGAKWLPFQRNPKEGGGDRKKQLLIDLDVWGDA